MFVRVLARTADSPDPGRARAWADSGVEIWLATISIVMACMRMDRSNAELLAVVAKTARRFSAAVVGVVARQASMHSAIMAIGPGVPPDRDLEKFHERAAAVEAEFRSAATLPRQA